MTNKPIEQRLEELRRYITSARKEELEIECKRLENELKKEKSKLNSFYKKIMLAAGFDEKFSTLYSQLGVIYSEKRDYEKAAECFKRLININPKNATAHNNLGVVLNLMGESDEALVCCKVAVGLNPRSYSFHENLSHIYCKKGMQGEGYQHFQKALQLKKDARY